MADRPNGIVMFFAETGVINGGDDLASPGWFVSLAYVDKEGKTRIASDGIGPFNTVEEAVAEGKTMLDDYPPLLPSQGEPYYIG